MPALVTLTTDFGLQDPFVGIMKGVLLGIAPKLTIIDLTHQVDPQNIGQAAQVLAAALPFFPKNTIHVAVVDPGVGTARRPLVVSTPEAFLVGPDNGVLTPGLTAGARVYELTDPGYFLHPVSETFHGRDVFAPAAAWLARGTRPSRMGQLISDPVRLDLPAPQFDTGVLRGQVIYADRFGNLITNLSAADLHRHFPGQKPLLLKVGRRTFTRKVRTYAQCPAGQAGWLINSWDRVEVFLREGDAGRAFGLKPGAPATLRSK